MNISFPFQGMVRALMCGLLLIAVAAPAAAQSSLTRIDLQQGPNVLAVLAKLKLKICSRCRKIWKICQRLLNSINRLKDL